MKKRIVIPIVGQGSIIHIIRTGMLDKLKEFCEPVVALLWNQEDLIEELKVKGYEVTFIPPFTVSSEYMWLKSKINIWYLNHKLKTPSVSIQQKYLAQFRKERLVKKFRKRLREDVYKLRFKVQPNYINGLLSQEKEQAKKQECYPEYVKWLKDLKIEGLFTVTPFLQEVELMARILQNGGLPIIASIHSFDNVTKRGWLPTVFDHYIVWNKFNKAELQRIHKQLENGDRITVAGAPQFDFHYKTDYHWSKDEWRHRLNIPAGKKIILYSGGPVSLLPDEPQYLKALKEAVEEGKISRENIILFRCHPLDKVERWKKYVGETDFIVYDSAPNGEKKLDYANVKDEDIKKLMSTLKHTDIHINVVSTMAVDGSTFHKPQIGPYYDDINSSKQNLFRQMYYQEHYRPIMDSKAVSLAHTRNEYIDMVGQALEDPSSYVTNSKNCVREIITYSDGQSTNRAVEAIKNFLVR
jgi:CDP-glycerol glycerophosphotransferase (TagB/SpsB family)